MLPSSLSLSRLIRVFVKVWHRDVSSPHKMPFKRALYLSTDLLVKIILPEFALDLTQPSESLFMIKVLSVICCPT
jgi:hypothetical protein